MTAKKIFINLPAADLPRTLAFWKALGFSLNPDFSGDTAACIVISEHIHVMALTHPKFREFTPREICDTSKAAEVLNTFSCGSREEVDALVAKAVANGGSIPHEAEDYGFMYHHCFADPDGHGWGLVYMTSTPPQA